MELSSAIISLLVGVAVLITGMNMMSDGLKKIAGRGVKKLFKKIKDSPFAGLGIGAAVTAIIQSSAATCVMVIGFINAGVATVYQGVAMMMGAYIGTTVTGILVSLSSFNISAYFSLFAFIGVILMFFKNTKVKQIGQILCGLGFVFIGVSGMSSALKENAQINAAIQSVFASVSFPMLLLVIGAILTIIMQSSSAVTGIMIVMVGSNAIPFSSALYVAIGATIGTYFTTLLATIGASVDARRAGFMSLIIKVGAGLFGMGVLWIFEAPLTSVFAASFGSAEMGIALFMLFFNIVTMFAAVPLLKPLEALADVVVKDKDKERLTKQILYIDERLLSAPNIALSQTKKEILHMMELAKSNFIAAFQYLVNDDATQKAQISEREDDIDFINNTIANYLIALSERADLDNARRIGAFFHVINDVERIGDYAYDFYEAKLDMIDKELSFSKQAKGELNAFFDLTLQIFDQAYDIFKYRKRKNLPALHSLEDQSDVMNREYASNHYRRIQKGECNNSLSPYFSNVLLQMERICDHLTNVGYSIVNPVGDED